MWSYLDVEICGAQKSCAVLYEWLASGMWVHSLFEINFSFTNATTTTTNPSFLFGIVAFLSHTTTRQNPLFRIVQLLFISFSPLLVRSLFLRLQKKKKTELNNLKMVNDLAYCFRQTGWFFFSIQTNPKFIDDVQKCSIRWKCICRKCLFDCFKLR